MTQIKIDTEVFEVPDKVYSLFVKLTEEADMHKRQADIHLAAVGRSGKMVEACRRFVTAIVEGDRKAFKILKEGEVSIWDAGERLKEEWDMEVRSGLTGWLQENWTQICSVSCKCGERYIHYESVRNSNNLICEKCYKRSIELPNDERNATQRSSIREQESDTKKSEGKQGEEIK